MLSPNSKLQDRYRIIRHLDQGGMGSVFEAIDENVNCIVVVKEFLKGDPAAFKREAELLANLRHPLLPRVTDHFSADEGSFLVMDFIPGNDLAELLQLRGSPFPVEQVLDWADELLKVLEYLHRQGVLHRDIKPSNLKLMRTGEIFLLDFGLAKGAAGQMSTLTTNRSVPGHTLTYAPLEQIHGHGTDARSDLYSLGATLYHLLTGVQPEDAPTRDLAVNEEDPDPLRPAHELNPQVWPAVSAVIQQAMAISRKRRPVSAAEMRRLLSEASRAAAPLADEEEANEEQRQHESDEEKRRAHETRGARQLLLGVAAGVLAFIVVFIFFKMMRGTTSDNTAQNNSSSNTTANTARATLTPTPRPAQSFTENINGVQLEMTLIPAGTFMMGSPYVVGESDEHPQHRVTMESFYIGKYKVTQAQYREVMGTNPANFQGANLPVEQVSWDDAKEFCRRLSQMTGREYRLPSEAEWEYTCRAGTTTEFTFGDSLSSEQANFNGRQPYGGAAKGVWREKTTQVGSFQPNGWGLYDMHGNVWEWCEDWYHESYNGAPEDGSAWSSGGEQKERVLRGGAWNDNASSLRSANHYMSTPDFSPDSVGFRVVAVARAR